MKKTLITLACAAVAPLAFAQTSSTTTTTAPATGSSTTTTSETTKTKTPVSSTTETTTSTTSTDGTVSTFEPGKTIVVRRTGVTDPISYTLGKTVEYVNKAGKTIEASMIKPGVPVHVYYSGPETSRTVTRVVVDQ